MDGIEKEMAFFMKAFEALNEYREERGFPPKTANFFDVIQCERLLEAVLSEEGDELQELLKCYLEDNIVVQKWLADILGEASNERDECLMRWLLKMKGEFA